MAFLEKGNPKENLFLPILDYLIVNQNNLNLTHNRLQLFFFFSACESSLRLFSFFNTGQIYI